MKDTAFRKSLADSRKARNRLDEARATVAARMEELVVAKKAALKTEAEWQTLEARLKDAEQAIRENQAKTFKMVRERIAPKKEISK